MEPAVACELVPTLSRTPKEDVVGRPNLGKSPASINLPLAKFDGGFPVELDAESCPVALFGCDDELGRLKKSAILVFLPKMIQISSIQQTDTRVNWLYKLPTNLPMDRFLYYGVLGLHSG